MNTLQIEYLREAIKAGSFSRAADSLNINQSILSRQVAALEQELGCSLLKRHGRGVAETPAALKLLEISQIFLQELALLKCSNQGNEGELKGAFKIGVPIFFSQSIAPLLMARIRKAYPFVNLLLREGHSGDLLDWLLAGEIGAAVIYDSKRPRQFKADELFRESSCVVGSVGFAKSYGIDVNACLSMRDLAQLPLLLPTQRHGTRLDLDKVMKRYQLQPNIAFEIDAFGARMLLVRQGNGVTIFESAGLIEARRDQSLFVIPLREPLEHKLMWLDGRAQDQSVKWRKFISHVKTTITQLRRELVC